MKITFAPRGILQIDEARITYKNFEGRGSKYNREGDRNFALIIPEQEIADEMIANGWNVRIKAPREEGDRPFMYLPINVKFNENGPHVYLKSGDKINILDEETVGMLDHIRIASVDLDVAPYNWEMNGRDGISAYLRSMKVTQYIEDRFYQEYSQE